MAQAQAAEAAAAAAEAGGSSFPQFDSTWFASQVFWLIVFFVLLYVLLSKFVLPKMQDILETRQSRIEGDLEKAEQTKAEAEKLRAEIDQAIEEARSEAFRVSREISETTAAENAERQKQANEQLAEEQRNAEAEIAAARKDALANVREVAEDVAGALISKVTGSGADKAALGKALDAVDQGPMDQGRA